MKVSFFVYSNMSFVIVLILYFSLCLLYLSSFAYVPVDIFSINCGSLGNSSDGSRTWAGDINSKYLLTFQNQQEKASVTASALGPSPSIKKIPYSTARLSYSSFTYSFSVTAGQKFIRLYFYPTSYEQGFDRSKAFFSVTSGDFTLLKDFNASLTADADADPLDTISTEYIINVDEGHRLNLTFSPSKVHPPDSYAFVNGIEIVSMPTDLYYTKSRDPGLNLVSSNTLFPLENTSALEKVYRLNVGGKYLSPNEDTGMLRTWEGDDEYVITPSALPVNWNYSTFRYTGIPNYTAPVQVYSTARSMGKNGTLNKVSNLTWEFSVDSGFAYMLRLHFCEFTPKVTEIGDRVFEIYIADKLAEKSADIISFSGGMGIPVYRDYAVFILGNQKKSSLSLNLHPSPTSKGYDDAILNGLEIFKISQDNNLAGPNPDPLPPTPVTPPKFQQPVKDSSKRRITIIIATVVGVVSCVTFLFLVYCFLNRQRKKLKDTKSGKGPSSLPSNICRHFSIAEIRIATENFNELFIIGKGGFGNVYKGYIDNFTTPVAIKRLNPESRQGSHEFMTEIEMLSQLRHLHLVSLIGYCNDENEMILIYEFMARGTLRDHLYDTDNQPISWKQRLNICIGAARGLQYLHAGVKHTIIHRDVKSTNILLDEKWVAKISDFGLSKIGPSGISRSHISTVIKGSFGYLDPDYYIRQRLTLKSDVYAFGVVLLEVLCGRSPLLRNVDKSKINLVAWAQKCYHEGIIDQTLDPLLTGTIVPESLRKFSEIAMNCLLDDGNLRPPINDVMWGLEFALQLQENGEKLAQTSSRMEAIERGGIGNEDSSDLFSSSCVEIVSSGVSMTSSASEEQSSGYKETNKLMPECVFFEIMDPKAR